MFRHTVWGVYMATSQMWTFETILVGPEGAPR